MVMVNEVASDIILRRSHFAPDFVYLHFKF